MASALLAGIAVLIIGDSHLTTPKYLITSLHEDLVAQGAQVHTLGVCGANAAEWMVATPGTCGSAERIDKGPVKLRGETAPTIPIKTLIADEKPNLVIIVMGDTMAGYKMTTFPKTSIWTQVTGLTKAIASTKTTCVWVGPAWGTEGGKFNKTFARVELMSNFLGNNVAPCVYIDSLKFSKPGAWATTDGQHLTEAYYKVWGDAIAKQLVTLPAVLALKKK